MHTPLVSWILRDKTLWEEVTLSEDQAPLEEGAGVRAAQDLCSDLQIRLTAARLG